MYDAQRTSNNFLPQFTNEECIIALLWGFANSKFTCKDVYKFIKTYYAEWLLAMPKYKALNKRFCYLSDAIKTLADELLSELTGIDPDCITHLMDSIPIVVAKQSRNYHAKIDCSQQSMNSYLHQQTMEYAQYGEIVMKLAQNVTLLPITREGMGGLNLPPIFK